MQRLQGAASPEITMPRKQANSPRESGRTAKRTTPSTRKPWVQHAAASVDQPGQAVTPDAALLQAPEHWAGMWSQWAGQMQRAGEQALRGLGQDAAVETEAVQHAQTPQQWAGLPAGFAAEQAARWAQLSSQVAANLLDVQATLFKNFEAVASHWMAPWFTHNGRIAFGSAQDIVEPPEQAGPMPMLQSAQRIWSESAKVWLNAMSHDLQGQSTR
jgi:hypothetical protein